MQFDRLVPFAAIAFLSSCRTEGHYTELLDQALSTQGQVQITASCAPLLGPAVALFQVPPDLAQEALSLTGRFSGHVGWSLHNTFSDFEAKRSRRNPGIAATLLDAKPCLQKLTPKARAILFEAMPGAYFASPQEDMVILLLAEPAGQGVLLLQAP